MEDTNWHEWPQIEFDIEQFEDVQDWAVNRFGMDTDEVVLVGRGTYNFHIAVKDSKLVNFILLKFEGCKLQPNQIEKDVIAEDIKKQTDIEIQKLITELQAKISVVDSPYKEAITENIAGVFLYESGVWTNVKE